MIQPPNSRLLANQLDRARRDLDPDDADFIAQWITTWWEATEQHGPHRGKWCAIALLLQSGRLRQQDPVSNATKADILARAAEAFVIGWRDELVVQTSVDELLHLADVDRLGTPNPHP